MKKVRYFPYILLILFLLLLFSIPQWTAEKLRSQGVALSKRFWRVGTWIHTRMTPSPPSERENKEIEALQLQLLLLKAENDTLHRLLSSSHMCADQVEKIHTLDALKEQTGAPFYARRLQAAQSLLELKRFSLPAQVIYRNPADWNSTLWVDVGAHQNGLLGKEVVAVGSPVLKGPHLIGVVECVADHKSRVRLLTDGALIPSVRVARGGEKDRELKALIQQVLNRLSLKDAHKESTCALESLLRQLNEGGEERFLAKGELIGSSGSLWKKRAEVLKGVGFNYDFEDDEGPPLELESGRPIDQLRTHTSTPLIQVSDLLVTTGMDGIFPKDLPVAHVIHVFPLKEGSPSFDIQARLSAGPLDSLLHVTILPPLIQKPPFETFRFYAKEAP